MGWIRSPTTQKFFQFFWISLALVFLVGYVSQNWPTFTAQNWQISWINLSLAVLFTLLRKFLGGVQWGLISRYGREDRTLAAFAADLRVYFLSNLAAYIPGSVWLVASRVQLNSRRGASVLTTSAGMVLETGLFIWSSCLIGLYTAALIFPNSEPILGLIAVLLVGLALIAIQPALITRLLRPVGRLSVGTAQLRFNVSYWDGLLLLFAPLTVWVAGGLSHFFLVRTFYQALPLNVVPHLTSAFALAWTIGYLTPIAPSGLGVRDGILAALFSLWMPGPVAVVVTVTSRLLLAMEDIIAATGVWLVSSIFTMRQKKV